MCVSIKQVLYTIQGKSSKLKPIDILEGNFNLRKRINKDSGSNSNNRSKLLNIASYSPDTSTKHLSYFNLLNPHIVRQTTILKRWSNKGR